LLSFFVVKKMMTTSLSSFSNSLQVQESDDKQHNYLWSLCCGHVAKKNMMIRSSLFSFVTLQAWKNDDEQ
jgi:hypothetical protein